jgi:hypothetical protein
MSTLRVKGRFFFSVKVFTLRHEWWQLMYSQANIAHHVSYMPLLWLLPSLFIMPYLPTCKVVKLWGKGIPLCSTFNFRKWIRPSWIIRFLWSWNDLKCLVYFYISSPWFSMVLAPILILFQVINAYNSLRHKGCISVIKLSKITNYTKNSLFFCLICLVLFAREQS